MKDKLTANNDLPIFNINYYQVANSDWDTIKSNFVVRLKEFDLIVNSLLTKKEKDPLQNELILGRRGSGKSTLLKRIEIEIYENAELNTKYIPVNLAEEQAGIYRLFDLWEQVLMELKIRLNAEFQLKNYVEFSNPNDYTRYLFDKIHSLCLKSKRKVILLLDNFDRIVENLSDDGNLFREILINYSDIGIIAASTRMDEHFWKYDMPFYEFFRRHFLGPLSTHEIFTLLYHWSDVLQLKELKDFAVSNQGKIENIRILTDGLPRTLQFFVQLIISKGGLESYQYLEKLIDNATPLYQERLNNLSPPQRKVVNEMAFLWEACSTGQIAEVVRMESKLVSATLKYLTDKGITDKIETSGRNHLYRISERFFNLWIIMTQGNPNQKRKARWLSIFLENWYDAIQLKNMAKDHLENLKVKSKDPKKALVYSKAFSKSKYISLHDRDNIINLTNELQEKNESYGRIELPEKFEKILNEIDELFDKKDYKKAIKTLEKIENEDGGIKFYGLGLVYYLLNNYNEAERYYLKAIDKGHVDAMYSLAILYQEQKKLESAEQYYLKAIENGNVNAMFNLANLYSEQNKPEFAEQYYIKAIENGDIYAKNNLLILYYSFNKNKEKASEYINGLERKDFKLIVELWNGKFNNVEQRSIELIKENPETNYSLFLQELLIHQQNTIVHKLFTNTEIGKTLQDKYQVLFYVEQLINDKNKSQVLLKIPPELMSTVLEVKEYIEAREHIYGYK